MIPSCRLCGQTVFQAAERGAYLARDSPKGTPALWKCVPGCKSIGTQDDAALRAIAGEPDSNSDAALRVDAERYRWLRANRPLVLRELGFTESQIEHWSNAQNEAKLDAAIDAARSAT